MADLCLINSQVLRRKDTTSKAGQSLAVRGSGGASARRVCGRVNGRHVSSVNSREGTDVGGGCAGGSERNFIGREDCFGTPGDPGNRDRS